MLKLLKKYGYELSLNKSKLFQKINENKEIIKADGFEFHLKTIEELFKYEIILNGLINKNKIDNTYYDFYHETQDVLKYLNYEEKQKIFNGELESFIHDMKHFKNIYIPYLEEFINERYLANYMMLTLKQHQLYIQQYDRDINKPYELYGYLPMLSSFSSLEALGEDDEYYYFYHEEFKRIFIFYKNEYKLYDEIYLTDKYCKSDIELNKVFQLVELYCKDEKEFLEALYNENYIKEKTYKKILKKMK